MSITWIKLRIIYFIRLKNWFRIGFLLQLFLQRQLSSWNTQTHNLCEQHITDIADWLDMWSRYTDERTPRCRLIVCCRYLCAGSTILVTLRQPAHIYSLLFQLSTLFPEYRNILSFRVLFNKTIVHIRGWRGWKSPLVRGVHTLATLMSTRRWTHAYERDWPLHCVHFERPICLAPDIQFRARRRLYLQWISTFLIWVCRENELDENPLTWQLFYYPVAICPTGLKHITCIILNIKQPADIMLCYPVTSVICASRMRVPHRIESKCLRYQRWMKRKHPSNDDPSYTQTWFICTWKKTVSWTSILGIPWFKGVISLLCLSPVMLSIAFPTIKKSQVKPVFGSPISLLSLCMVVFSWLLPWSRIATWMLLTEWYNQYTGDMAEFKNNLVEGLIPLDSERYRREPIKSPLFYYLRRECSTWAIKSLSSSILMHSTIFVLDHTKLADSSQFMTSPNPHPCCKWKAQFRIWQWISASSRGWRERHLSSEKPPESVQVRNHDRGWISGPYINQLCF